MAHELVGGSAQRRVAGGRPVLGAVHVRLQVLDAHAHRKRLALERDAELAQKLEHAPGGVTACEHEPAARKALLDEKAALLASLELDGAHARRRGAPRDLDAREPRAEAHLAAEVGDARADVVHDARQDVRADVGLGVPRDVLGRAGLDERVEHEAVQRALRAGGELAVRERAGSSRAELDVALDVELARLVEARHGLAAVMGVVSALDEQRLEAGVGERQCAEESRAARAHDDGTACGRMVCAAGQRGRGGHDLADAAVVLAAGEAREKRPLGVRAPS